MPLDGIVVNCLTHEFNQNILNGKIDKIYQPEKDELIIQIRSQHQNYRLLLSASSNNPRADFTALNKANPVSPPMFCMLLRKHLTGGKIVEIVQPDFERIIRFSIEAYNDLGDLTTKYLIIEIMGRHSNIILMDSEYKIIDSIKHVDISISSVRQVLPGLTYKMPPSQEKRNPLNCPEEKIFFLLKNEGEGKKIAKCIVDRFTGISPLIGREICYRALQNTDYYMGELDDTQIQNVAKEMVKLFNKIKSKQFTAILLYDNQSKKAMDFSAVDIRQYNHITLQPNPSISNVLESFYTIRDLQERLKQKSSELLKTIHNNLERCKTKLAIQKDKLNEVANREQYKIYGNLITANIYKIQQGMRSVEVENFYEEDFPKVSIPLKPDLPPSRNAQRYFDKYTKYKNAAKIVKEQMEKNLHEIEYLESIHDSIMRATNEQDLNEIREELIEQGYLKRKNKKKNQKQSAIPSKPMHFISSDGFHIFVGKNNKQNDELTLKFARNQDIWLHTKTIPGSHTIIRVGNKENVPDSTLMEAAMLATYFSKGRFSSNVAIDYTTIKNVKKPSGAKPGMVIYENYKTLYVTPKEDLVQKLMN